MRHKEGCSMSIYMSYQIRFIDLITSLRKTICRIRDGSLKCYSRALQTTEEDVKWAHLSICRISRSERRNVVQYFQTLCMQELSEGFSIHLFLSLAEVQHVKICSIDVRHQIYRFEFFYSPARTSACDNTEREFAIFNGNGNLIVIELLNLLVSVRR